MIEPLPDHLLRPDRVPVLRALEGRLRYRFKNLLWLEQAVAHSSYVNEQTGGAWRDNEKLEFLGDAVLELTVSLVLYKRYPDYLEGDLTKLRAAVVSRPTLGHLAQQLHLGEALQLGKGEDRAGGRTRVSLLADALEAVVGAIYLDSPRWWNRRHHLGAVSSFVEWVFLPEIQRLDSLHHKMDFKSMLQEQTQYRYKVLPKYRVLSEEGPPHEKIYEVEIRIEDQVYGCGSGPSKKQAEQDAARAALRELGALPPAEDTAAEAPGTER